MAVQLVDYMGDYNTLRKGCRGDAAAEH